jgi:hypothetical protein
MTKVRNTDPRILDDFANASETAKQFHDARAQQEATAIAAKYKGTPTFLKLVSMHLGAQADKAYSSHMEALAAANPETKLKKQIRDEVLTELGISGDTD